MNVAEVSFPFYTSWSIGSYDNISKEFEQREGKYPDMSLTHKRLVICSKVLVLYAPSPPSSFCTHF